MAGVSPRRETCMSVAHDHTGSRDPARRGKEIRAVPPHEGALDDGCTEPEVDTVEVLNSFLLGLTNALYVDIGCNIGYHAAHAAACRSLTSMLLHKMPLVRSYRGPSVPKNSSVNKCSSV